MKCARQKGSSRKAYGSETIRARKLMEHETGARKNSGKWTRKRWGECRVDKEPAREEGNGRPGNLI